MSGVEEKKQERTKAKQQVTNTSRRLTRAVDRGVDIDILTALVVELEKAYDDFCIIDEEYETVVSNEEHAEHRIVNGQELTTYRANVSEVYTGARNAFTQAKVTKTQGVAQLSSEPPSTDSSTQTSSLEGSTTPPMQGTVQSETSADLNQIAPSGFTTSSQTGNVTVSANNVQASGSHAGVVPMNPTSYGVPSTQQYLLPQLSIHQPTATNVYPGPFMNVLPHQPNNFLMGADPISHAGFSMTPTQQYLLPQTSIPQSTGGQVYPGQLVSTLPYRLGSYGLPAQSNGVSLAEATGVHLKKRSLPTFSGHRKDWPEFKAVWKQLAEGAYKNQKQP